MKSEDPKSGSVFRMLQYTVLYTVYRVQILKIRYPGTGTKYLEEKFDQVEGSESGLVQIRYRYLPKKSGFVLKLSVSAASARYVFIGGCVKQTAK
jgi:hypothetical protein